MKKFVTSQCLRKKPSLNKDTSTSYNSLKKCLSKLKFTISNISFIFLIIFIPTKVHSQNISGIINDYARVDQIVGNVLTVSSTNGFSVGDKVLIKARMLYSVLGYKVEVPDIELCAAVPRGGISKLQQEHELLNGLKPPVQKKSGEIKVYPNPSDETFFVECNAEAGMLMEVSDITGRLMQQFKLKHGVNTINCHSYAPGVYVYRVIRNGITQKTGKLILKK